MTEKLWFYRAARVFLIVLCTLLSGASALLDGFLLVREWSAFDIPLRSVMIELTTVHALGVLLLPIMAMTNFRISTDALRIIAFLLFQLGGAIFFALSYSRFPCQNFNSPSLCKSLLFWVFITMGSLSALLISYELTLLISAYQLRFKNFKLRDDTLQFTGQSFLKLDGAQMKARRLNRESISLSLNIPVDARRKLSVESSLNRSTDSISLYSKPSFTLIQDAERGPASPILLSPPETAVVHPQRVGLLPLTSPLSPSLTLDDESMYGDHNPPMTPATPLSTIPSHILSPVRSFQQMRAMPRLPGTPVPVPAPASRPPSPSSSVAESDHVPRNHVEHPVLRPPPRNQPVPSSIMSSTGPQIQSTTHIVKSESADSKSIPLMQRLDNHPKLVLKPSSAGPHSVRQGLRQSLPGRDYLHPRRPSDIQVLPIDVELVVESPI